MMAEELEMPISVLFEYEGLKKELVAPPPVIVSKLECELRDMGVPRAVVTLSVTSPSGSSSDHFILQRWCERWKDFVVVDSVAALSDGDRVTVMANPFAQKVYFSKTCMPSYLP